MSESNITTYVNNSFTCLKWAYYIQFPFSIVCISPLFTWIELGDADLRFSFSNNAKFRWLGSYINSVSVSPT
jgi:hypothetical protein